MKHSSAWMFERHYPHTFYYDKQLLCLAQTRLIATIGIQLKPILRALAERLGK